MKAKTELEYAQYYANQCQNHSNVTQHADRCGRCHAFLISIGKREADEERHSREYQKETTWFL
jgi:hypothetical protein